MRISTQSVCSKYEDVEEACAGRHQVCRQSPGQDSGGQALPVDHRKSIHRLHNTLVDKARNEFETKTLSDS